MRLRRVLMATAGAGVAIALHRDLSTLRALAHCHPGQGRNAYPQSGGPAAFSAPVMELNGELP